MAARYHSNIAEICEGELVDFEQVSEYWTLCGVTIFHDLLSTMSTVTQQKSLIHVYMWFCDIAWCVLGGCYT